MRPQPVHAVPEAPPFVLGMAIIRGSPVPVVDAASVLDDQQRTSYATRFVALKVAGRRVAFVVDEVLGIRQIDAGRLSYLPPLLAGAPEHVVSAIGTLDHELLLVLSAGRLIPESVWPAIESGARHDR